MHFYSIIMSTRFMWESFELLLFPGVVDPALCSQWDATADI